jgi:hypothetical protein
MTEGQLLAVARKNDRTWARVTEPDELGRYWVRDGRHWKWVRQLDGTALAVYRVIDDWAHR